MAQTLDIKVKGTGKARSMTIIVPIPKGSEYVSSTGKMVNLAYGLSAWDIVIDGHPVKVQVNVGRKNPDHKA